MSNKIPTGKGLLLFDGECAFCNSAVLFSAKKDPQGHILYAALSSKLGQELWKNMVILKIGSGPLFILKTT